MRPFRLTVLIRGLVPAAAVGSGKPSIRDLSAESEKENELAGTAIARCQLRKPLYPLVLGC